MSANDKAVEFELDNAVQFVVQRKVRFEDCDPAGIVFFPNYLRMLNSVVEDWLEHLGHPWTELVSQRRMGTPTAQLDTRFLSPSVFGETLSFRLGIEKLGSASLILHHLAEGQGRVRFRARQVIVATSLDNHNSIAWPDDVRRAITRFMENDNA